MVTAVVPQPGGIDDGVYSSRPVVVDETGEIIAVNVSAVDHVHGHDQGSAFAALKIL